MSETSVTSGELPQNYFELFGLPQDFSVDMQQLRSSYKALLLLHHPDRFAGRDQAEQIKALQKTDWINQAHATLSSLPKRAGYLLELKGFAVNAHATLSSDPDFLLEQLRLRELLEQIEEHKQPESALQTVVREARLLQQKEGDSFTSLYHHLSLKNLSADENVLVQKAADSMLKLRFIEKLFEEIEALQHTLLD
jgi:molecular chaperone HscB